MTAVRSPLPGFHSAALATELSFPMRTLASSQGQHWLHFFSVAEALLLQKLTVSLLDFITGLNVNLGEKICY